MNKNDPQFTCPKGRTLVLGATGKTGRRVASRLQALDYPIRLGSRNAAPTFDWTQASSWDSCLKCITSVYINYPSNLPIPSSNDTIAAFVDAAKRNGVLQLVLLSGRGETDTHAWENIVQSSGMDWTIIRSSWFIQNFSEGAFAEMVQASCITLPAGDIPEPFIDLDDIADVVVAALTEPNHGGKIYEVSGPRLLTFAEAAAELSQAMSRTIEYQQIPPYTFLATVAESGAPQHVI